MSNAKIIGTGSALPEKILTNDDLSKIVDTITILVRNTTPPNYVVEAEYTGLNLYPNGSISPIALTNNWNRCPSEAISGYHYIVVKHRNSIETWSDSVDFSCSNPCLTRSLYSFFFKFSRST